MSGTKSVPDPGYRRVRCAYLFNAQKVRTAYPTAGSYCWRNPKAAPTPTRRFSQTWPRAV